MRATKAPASNADLQQLYADLYAKYGQSFFTTDTRDISAEVLKECDWRGKQVLDLGCGDGYTSRLIAQQGASVTGVEGPQITPDLTGCNAVVADVQSYCAGLLPGYWDAIILQEVLEHLDDPPTVIQQCATGLKPGGSLIITCPHFWNPRGYVWMTLALLCDAKMSLTDLHYISPWEIRDWADAAGFAPVWHWRSFRHTQAHGPLLLRDFTTRLPKALGRPLQEVQPFLDWLEEAGGGWTPDTINNGACALYHLRKPAEVPG